MATNHTFDIGTSGFPLGAEGPPIELYQETIGRPVTGKWCQMDEEAYTEHLTDQMWQVLRIASKDRLPKNWEFTSEIQ